MTAPMPPTGKIIEGAYVTPKNVEKFLREQLAYGTVWNDRYRHLTNVDGASDALRSSGTLRPAFIQAIEHLLTAKTRKVRAGAVSLLSAIADELGAARIGAIYLANRSLFDDVDPAGVPMFPGPDLAGRMLSTIASRLRSERDEPVDQPPTAIAGVPSREQLIAVLRGEVSKRPWLAEDVAMLEAK